MSWWDTPITYGHLAIWAAACAGFALAGFVMGALTKTRRKP